jgi:hypothetical protein
MSDPPLECERLPPVLPPPVTARRGRRHMPRLRAIDEQLALAYADLSRDWTATALADVYGIGVQRVYEALWEYCPRVAAVRGRDSGRRRLGA